MRLLATGVGVAVLTISSVALANTTSNDFDAKVRDYLLRNPEVLIEMFAILEQQEVSSAKSRDVDLIAQNARELFHDDDAVLGSVEATHSIVEFVDYRCGYCRANHEVLIDYLKSNPDTNVIIKQFPILGTESRMMAEMALAVFEAEGQSAFERIHDAFLSYGGPVNDQVLYDIVQDAGFDAKRVTAVRSSSDDIALRLGRAQRLGRTFEIQGTPSYVSKSAVLRGFLAMDAIDEFIGRTRK